MKKILLILFITVYSIIANAQSTSRDIERLLTFVKAFNGVSPAHLEVAINNYADKEKFNIVSVSMVVDGASYNALVVFDKGTKNRR